MLAGVSFFRRRLSGDFFLVGQEEQIEGLCGCVIARRGDMSN